MNYRLEPKFINGEPMMVKVYAPSARRYTEKELFFMERLLPLPETEAKKPKTLKRKDIPFELQYLLDQIPK